MSRILAMSASEVTAQLLSVPSEAERKRTPLPTPQKSEKRDHAWKLGPRYDTQDALGRGAFGSVREAHDKYRNRQVAIKRITRVFDDAQDCKRFLREISLLSALRHENIVRLHDIVYTPADVNNFNELYIIMEVCDTDLKKLCQADVNLSPLHIKKVFYSLLVGLHYLHSAGVYHRDLKPANVLVNQNCTVKIADFGLSRAVMGEGSDANKQKKEAAASKKRHLTRHVVTRWYRSPELILLQDNYTQAIDIWSAGCILAELIGTLADTAFSDRQALFPGSSCYPLSPTPSSSLDDSCTVSAGCFGSIKPENASKRDQLNTIFNIVGTPLDKEIECLGASAQQYLRRFPKRQGRGLRSKVKCPQSESNLMDLLERTLRFSAQDRIQAADALRHKAMALVRDSTKEAAASSLVVLDFEKDPQIDGQRGSIPTLRAYYQRELQKYASVILRSKSVGGC